ncbi:hypothetical protein F5883DRAFT_28507 [Diaporthe sp. PMI_573]|nr:hypothetical protein F5883DRAFT_28507 [Diaporthaceae sp. PMI_573]
MILSVVGWVVISATVGCRKQIACQLPRWQPASYLLRPANYTQYAHLHHYSAPSSGHSRRLTNIGPALKHPVIYRIASDGFAFALYRHRGHSDNMRTFKTQRPAFQDIE